MVNDIGNTGSAKGSAPLGNRARQSVETPLPSTQQTPSGNGSENIEVSLSAELKQLQSIMKQGQEVDTDKVAQIKAQIEEGRYQVNSGNIANRILSENS